MQNMQQVRNNFRSACSHGLGDIFKLFQSELLYSGLFFTPTHAWLFTHLVLLLLELLSSFLFRLPVFSPIFFWSGPPVRPEAHLYPPLLCRGAGRLLRQPPPALPHLAQQEKTQHHELPHQQPGTGRPCHVHLLRPPDCILRFWPAWMGVWTPHVSSCLHHAVCSRIRCRVVPHGHRSGSLCGCCLSHPQKSRVPVLLGSSDSDLAFLSGVIHTYSPAHRSPGPEGCGASDGRVRGVLGWTGARPSHLLLFHSLLLLLCPTGCCLHLLLCYILSAEAEEHVWLDSVSRAEICEVSVEQTEEEDLLPAAGVRPLLRFLLASLTGTNAKMSVLVNRPSWVMNHFIVKIILLWLQCTIFKSVTHPVLPWSFETKTIGMTAW